MLKTFSIQTLGCRVNQYESDQLATLLRSRGLVEVQTGGDLRVVNTCSVTVQAASKSRQSVRRAIKLPVLMKARGWPSVGFDQSSSPSPATRTLITGCWATSNKNEASQLPGVDAVLTHHDDVAADLHRLLDLWNEPQTPCNHRVGTDHSCEPPGGPVGDDGLINKVGASPAFLAADSKPRAGDFVKKNLSAAKSPRMAIRGLSGDDNNIASGTRSLPLLGERQSHHQRAFLKIQDGCDAHCTYCIIPQLRPVLWSKSIHEAIDEARALVDAGHREIVLTGIFLGAYGQPTALRRRQTIETAKPLAELVEALCTQVRDLARLRFSSLEPGDLTEDLLSVMRSHAQVVPHLHLPLQSGCDRILHRMNRQYTRDDYLRLIDRVNDAFDRPAITTDIIVGFPSEDGQAFAQTLEIANRARFIHTHAFSFSPRPGTAAARWQRDFVRGPIVNERIEVLQNLAEKFSLEFRRQFLGETVQVLVERNTDSSSIDFQHGRCERYFDVRFQSADYQPGDSVRVRIDRVDVNQTLGTAI